MELHRQNQPAPETGTSFLFLLIARLLLILGVFGLAFVPLRGSQDEWWHLKTGQWIWQHGGLPTNDIFTYTGEAMRWHNHEWLSQLGFYGAFRLGEIAGADGLLGLILFKALVVVAAFYLVAMLAGQRLGSRLGSVACVIALVAADISRRTIHPRPPIFSYLLFALFLLMLYAWKRKRIQSRTLWLLVPLTVLWANLHGMVLLSFVAVGAFAAGEFLENTRTWWHDRWAGEKTTWRDIVNRPFLFLCGLTVALIIAAMAQPSGYHLFFLGRNFTADPLLQQIISEMKPTPGPFALLDATRPWWLIDNIVASPPGFWTFWVALALIFVLFLRNRFRLPYAADYLLLAFFTYQAVMHWRLLPLFAIAAAGPAASLIMAQLETWSPRRRVIQPALFLLLLTALVGWFNFTVDENDTFFERNIDMIQGKSDNLSDYPAPLMDYIIAADLPDHMFSDSNYCGYAIWRLSPEHHKLFTDNRFDLFGSQFIRKELTVFYAAMKGDRISGKIVQEGWREILDRNNVNFMVFRPVDRPSLHQALIASTEWRMVYYYVPPEALPRQWPYEANHVWVRNNEQADAIAARSEAIFKKQFPRQPVPERVYDIIRKQQQTPEQP